jgi:protein TonB
MKNNVKGFGISFVLHGAILCSFLSMGSLLPSVPVMAKVIDFSLVERLGAPQKQMAQNTPPLLAPPTLKPAIKTRKAHMINKISVPVQAEVLIAKQVLEPLTNNPVVAANISAEAADEAQVAAVAETITAATPTLTTASHGQAADTTNTDVSEKGFIKELYVKANFHYIKDNIQKGISYPRIARKMGWEGRVIVSFVVDKDGRIQDVHIVESSGFTALDKNAIATIKKAAPFPCPTVRAELVVPVVYRLA